MRRLNAYAPRLLQSPGTDVAKIRLSRAFAGILGGRFTKNYALACFDPPGKPRNPAAPMTMSVANTTEDASPMRGLLPLWVGVGIYALVLLAGNRLKEPAHRCRRRPTAAAGRASGLHPPWYWQRTSSSVRPDFSVSLGDRSTPGHNSW